MDFPQNYELLILFGWNLVFMRVCEVSELKTHSDTLDTSDTWGVTWLKMTRDLQREIIAQWKQGKGS